MKLRFNWFGITYWTRPYTSIGGFKSRMIKMIDIVLYDKNRHEKRFGAFTVRFQDDCVNYFSIYPFVITWAVIPDRKFVRDNYRKPNTTTG